MREPDHVADFAAIDKKRRGSGYTYRLTQRDGTANTGLGVGLRRADSDIRSFHAGGVGNGRQLLIRVGLRDVGLLVESSLHKFPERVIRTATDTIGIGCRLGCPVVHC